MLAIKSLDTGWQVTILFCQTTFLKASVEHLYSIEKENEKLI